MGGKCCTPTVDASYDPYADAKGADGEGKDGTLKLKFNKFEF